MKRIFLLLFILLFNNAASAGDTFKSWCMDHQGGSEYRPNVKIVGFQELAVRNTEQTGLYYKTMANAALNDGYHYYITESDKTVYHAVRMAYFTNTAVNVCILDENSNPRDTYITGVEFGKS